MNDQMREEFEVSPRFKGMDFTRSSTHPEFYESSYANGAWDGWKAAAETKFTAVDMATAAADGFRDGAASRDAEIDTLREEIAIDNKIIADRERLLSMFECPEHGQCVPYAMEQVEALRKSAPSKEIIWCACGDGHAANSYGAGFMDANNGVCENCDAAMSKEPKD